MKAHPAGRPGLTLVELLVVTTVIGIIALIAVLTAARFRELAAVQATRAELRNLATAIEHYRIGEGTLPAKLDDLTSTGYHEKSSGVTYCQFHVHDSDGYVHARAAYRGSVTHVELRYPSSAPVVLSKKARNDCTD